MLCSVIGLYKLLDLICVNDSIFLNFLFKGGRGKHFQDVLEWASNKKYFSQTFRLKYRFQNVTIDRVWNSWSLTWRFHTLWLNTGTNSEIKIRTMMWKWPITIKKHKTDISVKDRMYVSKNRFFIAPYDHKKRFFSSFVPIMSTHFSATMHTNGKKCINKQTDIAYKTINSLMTVRGTA